MAVIQNYLRSFELIVSTFIHLGNCFNPNPLSVVMVRFCHTLSRSEISCELLFIAIQTLLPGQPKEKFYRLRFGINHLTFFNKFSFTLAVGHRYDFVAYLFRQDSHHGNGCLIADKTSLSVIRPPTFKGNQRWVEPATGKNIAKSTDKSRQLAG
ncbi:hypothetical protein [Erwinia tasmaniensis]|uniref:Uncharacterized protein n=1 Tax=Erwinia tasmaniensis (strain DSM 17950 / CFBP 7177 / CIP 109463 / NCPPB 4357 / Et1/99) TaxID=465817 RepID=B2VGD8_ERWT9|nr:hypothetical protein [Erwinia tasmaniensis]CAO95552.1 hypothetical protein ETA_05060 [Erwinia tasmaniensis Et1/99]